ncbi:MULTISPECIES: aspartate/glutamate racemase family protein [unclassified Streptomyces]|uniref:glutamate racemase n=1 Tax=unclassified Streptomyces TaxID=2593676 RepID=UPI002DDA9C6E|nr:MULTISPECIES: aspartate/glutamate racemase family protein [unclassified Streptomyces]WSA90258.1 aspartate/glutamate racemase family protein [Streptomyces sp. NBC_01795]WSS17131.1 aspartate/glutamate racemase family protein [Streptomyces sp. NBC_01186]WSS45878.1 aspartate/glutamate racemase family protein [Streptomyces sp. NBC_01187]
MKIALMDSGIGLLAAAAAVRRARPDADLVLSSDPDGMPWGPRDTDDITARALECARAAASYGPDALIVACNTASVHALPTLRATLEPALPVVGTVPAVKPAAAAAASTGGPVAIWATPATTGSPYQRRLIEEFGHGADITGVPCHGLADAIESGDERRIDAAVEAAAQRTPPGVSTVVLGCTHYELVGTRIREALRGSRTGGPVLHGSAEAVAAQALRRAGAARQPDAAPTGGLTVLHSGRVSALPGAALVHAEGRLLAAESAARG